MTAKNRFSAIVLAFGVAATLSAVACGGDGGAGTPDATPGPGTPDANPPGTPDGGPDAGENPFTDVPLLTYVDPLIGTAPTDAPNPVPGGKGGSVFPGAVAPFGMVQWSPDTPSHETNGYDYTDNEIMAFSMTHYSGAGCSNNGELPIMPMLDPSQPLGRFSHTNEKVEAGYYSVKFDNGIDVELTATDRTGFGRFTYPTAGGRILVIDASKTGTIVGTNAHVDQDGSNRLSGFTTGGKFCGAGNLYKLYFAIEVDKAFSSAAMHNNKVTLTFPADATVVNFKIGLSYVSVANAKSNLAAENPGFDFEAIRTQTQDKWNKRLNAIQVDGGSDDAKIKFYTALYHSLLFPKIFSDVNGDYVGFDKQLYKVPAGHVQYADYSGWDIYRSQVQLLAVLFPKDASDMMQSLVNDAQHCGALPKWAQNNDETGVMVGDPGALIVANSYAFGAQDFDKATALDYMLVTGAGGGTGCNGLNAMSQVSRYLGFGYVPIDAEGGAPSTTLEYTSRDFAVAQFAKALGDDASYRSLAARSAYWRGIFHPDGFIRPRRSGGDWSTPLPGPGDGNDGLYVEGNAEQYTWMIPYDARGLFDALGGNATVTARLDTFFTHLNAGLRDPFFYMGNEPNFATPWLFNWSGAPSHTAATVRRIMEESFQSSAGGLPGNDDLGATSSWYVWAALGMYPAVPGVAGWVLGSPQFKSTKIRVHGQHLLTIDAPEAPAKLVQSLAVNGSAHPQSWLDFETVKNGGTLTYSLGESESDWGKAAADQPPSFGPGKFTSVKEAINAHGISTDADPAAADFDGFGYSYSTTALAAGGYTPGGTFTFAGVTFDLPPAGGVDHLNPVGERLVFPADTHGSAIAFLGSASVGPTHGPAIVTYADGTTATLDLGFSDWTLAAGGAMPSFGNQIAVTTTYRNKRQGGRDNVGTFIFFTKLAIDSSKAITSVQLPYFVNRGRMHVFGMKLVP
jgi:predicted alpha-1,2-mannosidase